MARKESDIQKAYELAREKYAQLGVDTEKALEQLQKLSISLHCWQADDVAGFEHPGEGLSGGGIQATGNYPGKAGTIDEVRQDMGKVYSLLPGKHRFNMHASYGDFGGQFVDRDEIEPKHFQSWIDWAKQLDIKLDFNCTCFSHPRSNDGFTLSSPDPSIRNFWIEHVNRCREISYQMGKALDTRTIHNIWIPDGTKDTTLFRYKYREILKEALDEIFQKDYPADQMADSLECKLFGIGSEAFVAGSHEFYMGYAFTRNKMLCIDMGHFHPTESVGDKVSALLQFTSELMFHFSRGVRWDSDHVITLNDNTHEMTHEIVRGGALEKVNVGLDFFDASINRIGAYLVGTRATQISFLMALLEPLEQMRKHESASKGFEKLALLEQNKAMPYGDVWDYFCLKNDVPPGIDYLDIIEEYEKKVLSKRS